MMEKKLLPDSLEEALNNEEEEELSYVFVVADESVEEGTEDNNEVDNNNITVYNFEEVNPVPPEGVDLSDKSKIKVKPDVPAKVRRLLECPHCDYINTNKFLLDRHVKVHNKEKSHKCPVCSKGFKSLVALNNHKNTHTGSRPYKCEQCTSSFATTGGLTRHCSYRHTMERPHKCTECDYSAVEYCKLVRHFTCHTGKRPHQCPHCTYAAADTFKLKRHIRIHTGERPYKCDICQASFNQSNSLKSHRLTHFPDKRATYQCSLCPAKSARMTDLRGHIRLLHTATNPIICKKCGKMLEDRYSYKLHIRTHIGEKSYKCNICPYASVSRFNLQTHMLVHTDEKPFACDTCDQRFKNKQLMKRHCNLYHNPNYKPPKSKPKKQECHVCGNRFINKGNLLRHLALHDPDSKVHQDKLGRKHRLHKRNVKVEATEIFNQNNANDDDSQFAVCEIIQVVENGQETNKIIDSTQRKAVEPVPNIKEDVENCFGFDEEEDDGRQIILPIDSDSD